MRERDGLDYLLLLVVAVLAAGHVPPYAVVEREVTRLTADAGIAAVAALALDIRVAVLLLAILGLIMILAVTDNLPTRN